MHRLLVDRLEVEALFLAAECHAQLVHHQRAAVRNGDAAADAGRTEVLPALEHLEQHSFGLIVETEKTDELAQHVILCCARQVELDRIFAKELPKFHVCLVPGLVDESPVESAK